MDRYQAGKKVSWIMIIANILLAILKISVGLLTGSIGLVADGFHSVSDIISTITVLIALTISQRPPDINHHYGHGQAEPIAAKLLGIMLFFTGVFLAYNTIMQLWNQKYVILSLTGFWVALLSIVFKELMFRYSIRIGEQTGNQALKADAWHHRSDAVSSVAAAIGIFGSYLGYPVLDPIAGLVVSLMIIKMGWNIIKEALNSLMTVSPDESKLNKIKKIAKTVNGVEAVAEIKAHHSGVDIYIDLKILVDYSLTVMEGHQIAAEVKQKIFKEILEAKEVLVHVDPMLIYGNN